MYRILTTLLCVAAALSAHAQRQVTVLDLDTRLPVKDVSVKVGKGDAYKTDYLGHVTLAATVDSVTFSHIKYEQEKLSITEVSDTMYLLPLEHQLDEVVVIGNDKLIKDVVRDVRRDAALYAPSGGIPFDFAMLINRRARRDRKHKEKAREILGDWEAAPIYKGKK